MYELFLKHAKTKAEATRVYSLLPGDVDILACTIEDLLAIKGIGRKSALLIMEVACDLAGKKAA